jgi:hypothetical protein
MKREHRFLPLKTPWEPGNMARAAAMRGSASGMPGGLLAAFRGASPAAPSPKAQSTARNLLLDLAQAA